MKLAPRSFGSRDNRGVVLAPIVIRSGWRAVRVIPPKNRERPATLVLVADRGAPDAALVSRAVDACRDLGLSAVITQALRPPDQAPFLAAAGTLIQELHLLNLAHPPARTWWSIGGTPPIRRHSPDQAIADLDYLAFEPFWHFDTVALRDALLATQISRLRTISIGEKPIGYLISGCSGRRGFIQRLAIHPDQEGRGYASALLIDALQRLGRRGVESVTINTQVDNVRARMLYERHGFVLQTERLGVIGFSLGTS